MSGVWCLVSGVRCRVSGVRCQVSGVRCLVSGVRCQVSGVRCQVYFFLLLFSDKVVELVGGRSGINGPTPSSFYSLGVVAP